MRKSGASSPAFLLGLMGAGLEVKGQGVYRTASRREDMPSWGAAFTLDGQPTEYADSGGAGVTRPLCLRGERHGLG